MTKKRLDRDSKWCFQGFPYYHMRMDTDDFHGLVSIVELVDGEYFFWEMPKAGKTPVCGKGMLWLQLKFPTISIGQLRQSFFLNLGLFKE